MLRRHSPPAQDHEQSKSRRSDRAATANYREIFQIGTGGFATVSVALAQGIEGFSKLVVLKKLREELSGQPDAAKMFMVEARLLARMNHPNIVQVYEVFRQGNSAVIVMEYVDGQPLSTLRVRNREVRSPLCLEFGIYILIKVLTALQYAHVLCDFNGERLGLIHRDISPHNVMVTYDGQVKLLDFGIAKLANAQAANVDVTRTGVIKGKLTYMAPEQVLGVVDHRADVFAVGVMLWEQAAQRRYWENVPDGALMQRLVSGDLPHLSERVEMPDELSRICRKALAHDPEQRYSSAAAMQEDLERYLAATGSVVTEAAIGQFVAETYGEARKKVQEAIRNSVPEGALRLSGIQEGPDDTDPIPAQSGARRIPWRIVTPVTLGVAAAIVVAVGRFGHDRRSTPPPEDVQAVGSSAASVHLRATTQPSGAVWFLDDRKLGADPVDTRITQDKDAHVLRAEMDGYAPFTRVIRVETDIDVTAVLAKKPSEVPQQSKAVATATRRVVATPRSVNNRAGTARFSPAVAPEEPASPPAAAVTPPPDTTGTGPERVPVQFGDGLKRTEPHSDRPPHNIDVEYPGGGG